MSKRVLLLPAALALALVLASCGGGGTTTIVKTTTVMRDARPAAGKTYLPDLVGGRFVEPKTYRFSVDGDLIGKSLDWHGWGEAKATAFGTLVERPASGLLDSFSGSVTVSAPRVCDGATYYTQVFPHLPAHADFVPTEPTKLSTPCD